MPDILDTFYHHAGVREMPFVWTTNVFLSKESLQLSECWMYAHTVQGYFPFTIKRAGGSVMLKQALTTIASRQLEQNNLF